MKTFNQYGLIILMLVLLSACSVTQSLNRHQALSQTIEKLQHMNKNAMKSYDNGDYQAGIKLWKEIVQVIEQYNSDYPPENIMAFALTNDKINALIKLGDSYQDLANTQRSNMESHLSEALQYYLTSIDVRPVNMPAYDKAIEVVGKMGNRQLQEKLLKDKQTTQFIHDKYSVKARKIDSSFGARTKDNKARNKAFKELYQWAYEKAEQAGILALADHYAKSRQHFETLSH